jgi:hypothetical protein
MRAAELTYLTSFPGLERSNEDIHQAQEYKKELQLTVPKHIYVPPLGSVLVQVESYNSHRQQIINCS